MKRILYWGLAACLIVPGVVVAGMAVADHVRTYLVSQRFDKLSTEQRIEELHRIGYKRDWRLAGLVRRQLENPVNREELRAAGYAAMRLTDTDLLALLRRRADEGPDDATRAMLITYAARLSDRDARLCDWLTANLATAEPWRRVGSAMGLLHLGRLEAGPLLIEKARHPNPEIAGFALGELLWATRPMAQAIGRPFALEGADAGPPSTDAASTRAPSIEQIEAFWQRYATVKLLNDVLARLTLRDPDWAEMGRLIHARDKVARWMQ